MIDPTSTDEPPPPPPPRPPEPRPTWWRSPGNRYLAGVAGGLGERFDVDPLFIRIGLVVATLIGAGDDGFSIVPFLYGLAWLTLPSGHERRLVSRLSEPDARREAAGAAALALGAAVLLPRLGPGGSDGLRFGVLLLGLAALLLSRRDDDRGDGTGVGTRPGDGTGFDGTGSDRGAGSNSGTGFGPGTGSDRGAGSGPGMGFGSGTEFGSGTGFGSGSEAPTTPVGHDPAMPPGGTADPAGRRSASGPAWTAPPWTRRPSRTWSPPRPRRPRRDPALWPLTLALLAVYAVVCAVLDTTLGEGLRPGLALSGALLIVGGVLLLSAWKGRARSTIFVGLALLPLWLAFVPGNVDRFEGSGRRLFRPSTVADASTDHELGYGHLEVDLSDLDLEPGQELRTGVRLTGGVAEVRVPADVELVVRGPVGLGSIRIEGEARWFYEEQAAFNRVIDWRAGPQHANCQPMDVDVTWLSFSDGHFDSVADLTAELERREWAPPSGERVDETGTRTVTVGVDEVNALCDLTETEVPTDPATVVIDLNLGLAALEVSRVPVD